MGEKFLGVPFVVWAVFCLLVSGVWLVVWPKALAAKHSGLRFVILRWFHSVVWLLLGLAAVLAGLNSLGGVGAAKVVALGSLLVYLTFMATVITSKRRD